MDLKRNNSFVSNPTPTVKTDIPAGLWSKCKSCEQVIYQSTLESNWQVCPSCGYYYPLTAQRRLALLSDAGSFQEMDAGLSSLDPLDFAGDGSYAQKLEENRRKTGMPEAVVTGRMVLDGRPCMIAVMDFRFMGASMGSAVGEKITRMIEAATAARIPALVVASSGGARMQEGTLSLMQMAKTSGALMRLASAGLPFIVLLTNPTAGGVTASFASLGDVILAEPKASICFAGARVIKQTIRAELPPGFQTSEFLVEHGFIDRIVGRQQQRAELSLLLEYFEAANHAVPPCA